MDIRSFFTEAIGSLEQALFPDKPVESFTQAFGGNTDMPFAEGHTDSLQRMYFAHLRMSPHYPEQVAAYNTAINSVESNIEKAAIAHAAAQEYIQPQAQNYRDHQRTFSKLVHNPVGDCDDYANFATGLLILGDVDKENILQVTAQVEYEQEDGTSEGGYHAFVLVKDGEGYHLIDNNLDQVYEFDPASPVIHGQRAVPDHNMSGVPAPVTLNVINILDVQDANGFRITSPAAYEALKNDANTAPDIQTEPSSEPLALKTEPPPGLTS